jgi:P27 family predicted phage terminase small subunit
MPDWLDGDARAMWEQVVPELQRLQILKPVDGAALAAYCQTWARFCAAQRTIAKCGMFVETERGPVKHPAVLIIEAASKELRAWSAEFGLTPSSESRIVKTEAPDADDDDPFG